MFRSSVYLGSLSVVCALFYVGSGGAAFGGPGIPVICDNQTIPAPPLTNAFPRVSSTQKGSLVIFSKIEIKWDLAGNLISDTILDLSNDYPDDVYVQGYFINGDIRVEELRNQAGDLIRAFEPGWNTADCRFQLTGNQPTWWSAARGGPNCQSFTVLDPQGPGRPDPDTGNSSRVLRGYAVFWAVGFDRAAGPTGAWREINWNHLKGDAVIVNYQSGAAWEYNGWSFQAIEGSRGQFLGTPGALVIGGEYEAAYDDLILDFYATNSQVLSSPNQANSTTVQLDTDLTLFPVDLDVRQDGCGPVLTKAKVTVCNENEQCFSGATRCICCWSSVRLSAWTITNNTFLRNFLQTDKGKARIEGIATDAANCQYSEVCGIAPTRKFNPGCQQFCAIRTCPGPGCDDFELFGFAQDSPLLGVAVKRLSYSPSGLFDMAGMNIHGTGRERAVIRTDLESGPSEVRKGALDRPTTGTR